MSLRPIQLSLENDLITHQACLYTTL